MPLGRSDDDDGRLIEAFPPTSHFPCFHCPLQSPLTTLLARSQAQFRTIERESGPAARDQFEKDYKELQKQKAEEEKAQRFNRSHKEGDRVILRTSSNNFLFSKLEIIPLFG